MFRYSRGPGAGGDGRPAPGQLGFNLGKGGVKLGEDKQLSINSLDNRSPWRSSSSWTIYSCIIDSYSIFLLLFVFV